MRKSTLFILALMACTAIWLLQDEEDAGANARAVAEASVSPDTTVSAAVNTLAPVPGATPPSLQPSTAGPGSPAIPDIAALMAELEHARDHRVVLERLLANPEERSGLYARHILFSCVLSKLHEEDLLQPSQSTRQDEARRLYQDRCASFSADELAAGSITALSKDPPVDGRFSRLLERVRETIGFPEKRDREKALIAEVLQTGDPLLLTHLTQHVIVRDRVRTTPDGSPLYQPEVLTTTSLAWSSAICEVAGAGCGPQEMNVVHVCARFGVCVDSRQALNEVNIRQLMGEEGMTLYRQLLPRFVDALRRQDVSLLMAPPVPAAPQAGEAARRQPQQRVSCSRLPPLPATKA